MKRMVLLVFFVVLTACATMHGGYKINTSGGDGSSVKNAVVIEIATGTPTEDVGIAAEYKWLSMHYPGYRLLKQTLLFENGKPYDEMHIRLADGTEKDVYFDISSFYGRW